MSVEYSHHHTPNAHTYTIELDPANYEFETKSLFEPRDKWFVNISNLHIPNKGKGLLQLEDGFSLSLTDSSNLVIKYIKYVENNLSKLH